MRSKIVESQESDISQLVAKSVSEFAARQIMPFVREWDENQHFPIETMRQLGELGLLGMLVPQEFGGAGLGYREYVSAIVELAKIDSAIGLSMAVHNSMCTNHILTFGNLEQKQMYLPKLANGDWIGAWGLTESNSGSDAGSIQTTAVRDGNRWVLNGSKSFVTHGLSGHVVVVIARTGKSNTSRNATAFIVERGTPGFSAGKKEDKLGMRASETAEIIFQDCIISDYQRLGNIGEGFIQALEILDGGRISIAALSLGIAAGAFENALRYAQERHQFGQAIANFQAIGFKLADLATSIEAAKLLTFQAADLKDKGKSVTKKSAMAKLYASEVAVKAADEAVQIFGGYGYTKDFPIEKFYRDAKLCTIGEGTSEIQRLVISRLLLSENEKNFSY